MIAFSVALRAQERQFAWPWVRSVRGILRLVLVSGGKLVAVGCVIGLIGTIAASRLLRSFLFGVGPSNPLVLTLAVISVLLLGLATTALPAQRAASTDPMQSLRAE